ncbi:MAG: methionyl-tRNA formyltransferase [Leptothrix sp. (in: b-proteobacteria)]
MRVAFAGTPEFARAALAAIAAAGHHVPLVLTQPDRPAGRGMKLQASPVKQLAQLLGLPVAQPVSLRLDGKHPLDAAEAHAALRAARPDVLVVAAYGLILPAWVLALPRLGCLNIHASLLPRWRGAAPIHRAIEAGDSETGITIMQMDAGLDTGAMLLREPQAIHPDDTTARLHDRLSVHGAALILRALRDAEAGTLQPVAQPAEGVTYAHKIDKAEAAIDWRLPAAVIERRVRAFDPFPGAHASWGAEAVKVWSARVVESPLSGAGAAAQPGEVLEATADRLVVACGEQALAIEQVQRPGGKRQSVREALQARPLTVGQVLGQG